MRNYNVGIIGLGVIGRTFLAEMRAHSRFTVVAAWDPSETSRAAAAVLAPDLNLVDSAEAVIADPTVELVYIASPPRNHCDYVLAAVAAGKAVYCEKPLGVDLDKSRATAAAIADSGLPNIVNFNHGKALSSNFVEERIAAGDVGTIVGIDCFIHLSQWPRAFQETASWLAGRAQGGFTREMLSHWIYLTRRLLGPGRLLHKKVTYPPDGVGAETRVIAEFDFGGVPLVINAACGGVGPIGTVYTIWGEKQSFRLHSGGNVSSARDATWREEFADVRDIDQVDRERSLDGVAALLDGEAAAMPSIADALAVQELIEEILA